MLNYLKKYWKWCIIAPLFMVCEITIDLLQPAMMATIVDKGVLAGDMQVVFSTGIRMILLVMFGGLTGFLCGWATNIAAENFGNDLRKDLFARVMNLSFQQTDSISTGSLVTRLTNDVTQVQNMVSMSMRGLVRATIMFAGGLVMLYMQSPRFAGITAMALPFILTGVILFMRKSAPMFREVQDRLDGVNNVMQEDIAGARVVKAYVKEEYEQSRFDKANARLYDINMKVQTLLAYMGPALNIVLNLCVVGILMAGGKAVQNGDSMTAGEIMAGITYVGMILFSVMFMANIFQMFTRAKASVARIKEVLSAHPAILDGEETNLPEQLGEIEFRHVRFAYPNESGERVLTDINVKVNRGETLAILGATGSGKTSMVNLIPRFYDATEGMVLVDGMDVRRYPMHALRERIAFVKQSAELYSRPVEANIRWGNPDADPWAIKRAAEIAQADDFICAMPKGYYTQVTEGGHSLSGGQKQRICIARAVLKNAKIMIFDDSTSALDLTTESKFYHALREAYPNATKIIVAQRIASVRNADHIAVLDDGHIAAYGTHDELMAKSAIYQEIYNSQLKEQSA